MKRTLTVALIAVLVTAVVTVAVFPTVLGFDTDHLNILATMPELDDLCLYCTPFDGSKMAIRIP